MNVLVVDDSRAIRTLVTAYIEQLGHNVVPAESGEDALSIFDENEIDLILMDIEMPGLDGFETTRRLRTRLGSDWIPIIFLSSNSAESHFSEGIQAGGDAYLMKPVNGPVLQSMVKAMSRIASFQDELKKLNGELERLAHVDVLTGLENRRGFFNNLEREWKRAKREQYPLSVILIDVDHFKLYNDNYGHLQGDDCLKAVARAMKETVKRPADLVGRFGGEEFVVSLPNTPRSGALMLAEEIRQAVVDLKLPHDKSLTSDVVTISLGVAEMSEAESEEALLQKADERLYHAKENGRNQVYMGK